VQETATNIIVDAKVQKSYDDFNALPADKKHFIHVYYGYGKGKTTAVMGLAIRALGAGKRVAIIQFDKGYDGKKEHYAERNILRKLADAGLPIEIYPTGCERMTEGKSFRFKNSDDDFAEAKRGIALAKDLIQHGKQDVLILDEAVAAVAYHLLKQEDIEELIELYNKHRRFELIMSGHKLWDGLEDKVDLVTEMRKVKHYFDKGIPAREGIEF
jgi:cob(I)alamin adenosyltransferase